MKDRQKIFLDKVVKLLVDDTRIDYDKKKVWFSFVPYPLIKVTHFGTFPPPYLLPSFFENYCRNQFGLTDDEIEYVWEEYRSIILDKISNREP